jgi:hypothetical protein
MSDVLESFKIDENLKVEFFLPDAAGNLFILGISLLGGDDVLAGAGQFIIGTSLLGGTDTLAGEAQIAFTWQSYECSVSELDIDFGGEVQDSLFFQPRPAQADITIQNLTIDPTVNPAMRPGVGVRVRIVGDDYTRTIYRGYLDTINVSYNPQNNTHIMQVTSFDSFKRVVNSRLALFDTLDPIEFPEGIATPYEVLEIVAEQYGTAMSDKSEPTDGLIPGTTLENFIPNTVMYEAIQVGLGLFWIDPDTEEFVFIPRPTTLDPEGKYSVGNNHNEPLHLCMSDIEVASNIDNIYNSLQVSLKSDSDTKVLVRNTDSIELYGEYAIDTDLNVIDDIELEAWATRVFNQTTTKLVQSVETPAINRLGALTHAAIIEPGETIRVVYQTPQLNINDTYTVTKVSHSIDVNNWFTTLELWKEF